MLPWWWKTVTQLMREHLRVCVCECVKDKTCQQWNKTFVDVGKHVPHVILQTTNSLWVNSEQWLSLDWCFVIPWNPLTVRLWNATWLHCAIYLLLQWFCKVLHVLCETQHEAQLVYVTTACACESHVLEICNRNHSQISKSMSVSPSNEV